MAVTQPAWAAVWVGGDHVPSYRCPGTYLFLGGPDGGQSLVVLLPSARCGMEWAGGDCVRGYIRYVPPVPIKNETARGLVECSDPCRCASSWPAAGLMSEHD